MSDGRESWSRREFVSALTMTGTSGLIGIRPGQAAAEPPPETTRVRLPRYSIDISCTAPQWVAEELLRSEGFTEVQFIRPTRNQVEALAAEELDFIIGDVTSMILPLDAGDAIVILTGVHGGCYELFGNDQVRSIRDLRGKTVLVGNPGRRAFVASMAGSLRRPESHH
jgi:NitT/TauT family transport system substrate-binding protein